MSIISPISDLHGGERKTVGFLKLRLIRTSKQGFAGYRRLPSAYDPPSCRCTEHQTLLCLQSDKKHQIILQAFQTCNLVSSACLTFVFNLMIFFTEAWLFKKIFQSKILEKSLVKIACQASFVTRVQVYHLLPESFTPPDMICSNGLNPL